MFDVGIDYDLHPFCSDICTTRQHSRSWLDNLTKKQPWLSPWLLHQSLYWLNSSWLELAFGSQFHNNRSDDLIIMQPLKILLWTNSQLHENCNDLRKVNARKVLKCALFFWCKSSILRDQLFPEPSKIRPMITSESLSWKMKIALKSSF